MLVFHIIIRAASGIFNHRITNNFDIPRPAFSPPREFRPKGERARFTEFRPLRWAVQIAIKKRGGIHFRLFSLLAPRVPTFRAANRGTLGAHPLAEKGSARTAGETLFENLFQCCITRTRMTPSMPLICSTMASATLPFTSSMV